MDIWQACEPHIKPAPLSGELVRIVESQEQIATTGLVDSLDEQWLLEELLEQNKPKPVPGTDGLHYLLATPFRYPPLLNGSRFGTRHQPSIFYASHTVTTALTESAYYRALFWEGMEAPPPSGKLQTQHTAFTALYHTERGLKLHKAPFNDYHEPLMDKKDYQATQRLGNAMRERDIAAFEFHSARDPKKGINVALFTPDALSQPHPASQQAWLCETTGEQISFACSDTHQLHHFPIEMFLVSGALPQPAF